MRGDRGPLPRTLGLAREVLLVLLPRTNSSLSHTSPFFKQNERGRLEV